MAKGYKVGEPIEVRFRCNGDPAVVNPTLVVLDETNGVFETLTLGSGLSVISGRTVGGSFTPDELGEWQATATDDTGLEIIKLYSVETYSINSVGVLAAENENAIALLDAKVDLNQTDVLASIASLSALIGGGGGHFG